MTSADDNMARIGRALNELATALQQLAAELEQPRPFSQQIADRTRPLTEGEPCGCSYASRCQLHESRRPRGCTCNGPDYASSSCRIPEHAAQAARLPDRDPSLDDG